MKRDPKAVSKNMARIKGKDTSIEKALRRALYEMKITYRKNISLYGHPDIYLPKYRICIFCDGDFFHGYDLIKIEKQLSTNKEFWLNKIKKNQERDNKINKRLVSMGYIVLRFWEHEIRNDLRGVLEDILSEIVKVDNNALL